MDMPATGYQEIKRRDLYTFLKDKKWITYANSNDIQDKLLNLVIDIIKININKESAAKIISVFCRNLLERWKTSRRVANVFEKKHCDWLEEKIDFASLKRFGRPKKHFLQASAKTKRRIVEKLLLNYSAEELQHAASISNLSRRKRYVSKMIKTARKTKLKNKKYNEIKKYTPEHALSLMIDLDLSKHQYNYLRIQAKERGSDLYPSYQLVLDIKKQCTPPKELWISNDFMCEIKLQHILDHTAERIILVQRDVLKDIELENYNFTMIYKCGLDGSSGHSLYKQKFDDDDLYTDNDMIITSMVPLQLYGQHKFSSIKKIVWQNPRTSSTRFCRPIKFQFIKETKENIQKEVSDKDKQIQDLKSTILLIENDKKVEVNHHLIKTMVDGKVCNYLMENSSSQTCYICGAKPQIMNNLDEVMKLPHKEGSLNFGLSSLHAHIRFFECLLHISYRLSIKKWQIRSDHQEEKVQFMKRKEEIQRQFRIQTGLLVDCIKQGSESTNDGNTARKFFQDPELTARITELDENLIRRFGIILEVISSGFSINKTAFKEYCFQTAQLYIQIYPWYPMPVTVHKVLIHGADVLETFMLPIGQLSEDAQEARHKDFRSFQKSHTRKFSRVVCNEDLLNHLLISSDPLVSSIRPLYNLKKRALSHEAQQIQRPEMISFLYILKL